MECETCNYKTDNKKSMSNHLRYGCPSVKKKSLCRCKYCNKFMIKRKPSEQGMFCNNKCYGNWRSENLRGENAPNYIHGRCNDNLLFRASREYKKWRSLVFKRDGYTCVICGDNSGGNLEADHIRDFALYPEFRLNINNGRTLCTHCHKKTNNFGGRYKHEA